MADISLHIKNVNAKLQALLKQFNVLVQENGILKKELAKLRQNEAEQNEKLEMLQQQQLILKASVGKMEEKEKKELEQKLNGYIRNIDKCISLISHK